MEKDAKPDWLLLCLRCPCCFYSTCCSCGCLGMPILKVLP